MISPNLLVIICHYYHFWVTFCCPRNVKISTFSNISLKSYVNWRKVHSYVLPPIEKWKGKPDILILQNHEVVKRFTSGIGYFIEWNNINPCLPLPKCVYIAISKWFNWNFTSTLLLLCLYLTSTNHLQIGRRHDLVL